MEQRDQLNLGQFIAALKECVDEDKDKGVFFDFGMLSPTELSTYRGSYDQLALGFSDQGFPGKLLVDLIADLEKALAEKRELYGYKGGDYPVDARRIMWAAQDYSRTSGTAIVGVRDIGYIAIIETEYHEV